jgi:hypothetical protein
MLAGLAGLVLASLFTGAAFYINFAEHPARMTLPADQALAQWAPAYKRGFAMQAGLAVAGGASAMWCWHLTGGTSWLLGGLLLLANWPFTLVVIMPVNRRLLAQADGNDPLVPALLRQWNRLHGCRTLLGAAAMLAMLSGLTAFPD